MSQRPSRPKRARNVAIPSRYLDVFSVASNAEARAAEAPTNPHATTSARASTDSPAAYIDQPKARSTPRNLKRKVSESLEQSTKEQVEAFNAKKIKRGALKEVTEMPIDVLFEIFSMLQPLDLLNLSRTSKSLRSMLMKKNSIAVWRRARANLAGLPECPDDLTEPQYTELVFGRTCFLCNQTGDKHFSMGFRVRLRSCATCAFNEANFIHDSHLLWPAIPPQISLLLPTITAKSPKHKHPRRVIPRRIILEWKEIYEGLGPGAYPEWFKQLETHTKEEKKLEASLFDFLELYSKKQEQERRAIVGTKMAIIIERTKLLGWSDEVAAQGSVKSVAILNQSTAIQKACRMDTISATALKRLDPEINRLFSAAQDERLLKIRNQRLKEAIQSLSAICNQHIPRPSIGDVFAFHPEVEEACIKYAQDPTISSPREVLHSFEEIYPSMRDRWVQRCREQLIELLPRTGGEEARELSDQSNGSPTPVDILELATSFFQCPKLNCRAAQLRYPSVLEHSCARESPIGSLDQHHQQHQDSVTEALHRLVYKNDDNPNGQTNLSAVITAPHPEVVSHCLFTLELLGLDPQTTTVEQMNELDPIFECLPCGDEEKGRFVMAWETMFSHRANFTRSCRNANDLHTTFELLEAKLVERARDHITTSTERFRNSTRKGRHWSYESSTTMLCTVSHCMKTGGLMNLRKHIRQDHLRQPEEGDIIVAPGTCAERQSAFIWPPREDLSLGPNRSAR